MPASVLSVLQKSWRKCSLAIHYMDVTSPVLPVHFVLEKAENLRALKKAHLCFLHLCGVCIWKGFTKKSILNLYLILCEVCLHPTIIYTHIKLPVCFQHTNSILFLVLFIPFNLKASSTLNCCKCMTTGKVPSKVLHIQGALSAGDVCSEQ